ncbi:MAG: diguanylate cyclase [Proteobacteria bacterium]|nr:diguanylate cyclase [Pseudomonadota bacterium]
MKNISNEACMDILGTINEGIRILDNNGIIIYANQALCTLLGYKKDELIGKSVFDLYPENDKNRLDELLADRKAGKSSRYEACFLTKTGRKLFTEVSAVPIFDDQGQFSASFTIIHDITAQKQLEKKLVEEKDFLNGLIALCPDGIIGVNQEGKIIIFNRAAEQLTLHKAEDVTGKMSVVNIYESLAKARLVKKNIYSPEYGGEGRLEDFEVEIVTRKGEKIPIRLSATLLYKDGHEIGNVGFFHDITPRKQLEARLRELSIRDGLSGLFNHRHFYTVLAEELIRSQRYARPLSLICLDIDNFKQFNDNLGHLEGDNIIRLVGNNLVEIMRSTDRAFRYGGDEFMILLPETTAKKARFSAEKIRKHFNSTWPFETICKKLNIEQVSLSLGVAEANPHDVPNNLIQRADLAMYEAKRAGGNRTVEAGPTIGKS